ncbi:uncharacterized protein LOC127471020 isoform X1 [Manacus candei]|uniref:uncharacterized protein LOC127471020 isoform X1 n=1 Tax=Manacus candei TaxID=415023 RepID=UPI002227EFB4|nr:uncharacterized protein LOC127471020 isoform X1 [Manacus candei]
MEKKTKGLEHVILDPPGQAEVTASGAILTEALAASFPSVAVGVPDASGRTNPVAFMSNVLCCVPAGEDFLPLWVSPSAWQEQSGLPGRYSPGQRQEPSYLRPRLPLSLRSPWVCRTPLAGLTLWLLCPTCCAACLQGHLPLSPVAASPVQPGLEHLQGWGSLGFPVQCALISLHWHREKFCQHVLCDDGEDFLPLWVSPSAWQEQSGLPGRYSPGQRQEPSYLRPRLPLSLRSPWVCWTPLAGLTLWLLCPTCCAACLQGHLPLSPVAASPVQPGLEHLQGWGSLGFPVQCALISLHRHREKCCQRVLLDDELPREEILQRGFPPDKP